MNRKALISWSIEFGPIAFFFLAFEKFGFMPATKLFVALTALALIIAFFKERRVAYFPLVAGVSVLIFGVLTIFQNDPFYLIIKDTFYNGIFGIVLSLGLAFGKPLLKTLFGELFAMSDRGWQILTLRWAILFILLTIGNEIVRIFYSTEVWVHYKAIATLVTLVFGLYQFRLSAKERLPNLSNKWGMRLVDVRAEKERLKI